MAAVLVVVDLGLEDIVVAGVTMGFEKKVVGGGRLVVSWSSVKVAEDLGRQMGSRGLGGERRRLGKVSRCV
jgi:hypothetical protein